MASRIVAISGRIASGKSTLARGLHSQFGCLRVSTHELLHELLAKIVDSRSELQGAGETLDRRTGGEWVAQAVAKRTVGLDKNATIIVDAVRIRGQVDGLRRAFGS